MYMYAVIQYVILYNNEIYSISFRSIDHKHYLSCFISKIVSIYHPPKRCNSLKVSRAIFTAASFHL